MADIRASMLLLALLMGAPTAYAVSAPDCASALDKEFTDDQGLVAWDFAPIAREVLQYEALAGGGNPLRTSGDFDGDGRSDIAFLIQSPEQPGPVIAVCLSSIRGVQVIENLACHDGLVPAVPLSGKVRRDVIGAQCFEKSMVRYSFKSGAFVRLSD